MYNNHTVKHGAMPATDHQAVNPVFLVTELDSHLIPFFISL